MRVTTSDVAIDYIVLDESCFGSAGSSMEIEMLPALRADSSLSVDEFANLRLLVTFDITNTEDGVTRGSFEIDRGMFNAKTDYLNFERCNTLPNIVVTAVQVRTTGSATSASTTSSAPTATKAAVGVTTSDIAIEYIVLDESCFSSAGSSMEIEMFPVRAAGSSLSLDDLTSLRLMVTFDITNTEGGVTRGSFEIDRGMFNNKNDYLSFERCNTLPNIVVTGVTER